MEGDPLTESRRQLNMKNVTFRKLTSDLYHYCFSLSQYPKLYSSKILSIKQELLNDEVGDQEFNQRNTRSEFSQVVQQLFIQLRTKFLEHAREKKFYSDKEKVSPYLKLTHNDVINFFREYLKEFRPL